MPGKVKKRSGHHRQHRNDDDNAIMDALTDEEETLRKKIAGLNAESGQVISGRGASEILAEVEELKKQVTDLSVPENRKKVLLDSLQEVSDSLSFENNLEKHCGRVIQIGLMAMTIVPALLTFFGSIFEFATRPAMIVAPARLTNVRAVVTGGTGAVGLELAIMLANSGADVVVSCHGARHCDVNDVETRLARLGLLRKRTSRDVGRSKGWIDVWPLQLESFQSVRKFAARVAKEWDAVDLIVHNAATKKSCNRTVDGHEYATQVNYLSPFLLTTLLYPTMRRGGTRVVHVTCEAGLQMPDWLPWPLRRTQAELLPRLDIEGLDRAAREQDNKEPGTPIRDCSPLVEYANSKLAVVAHSHELNRRMSGRGVSHVVNPGAMDSPFGRSASVPSGKQSARSSMLGYFPPVWIANKVYEHTIGKGFSGIGQSMSRTIDTGAKAIFHVSTTQSLGEEENGGGLFADTAGAFTACGKSPPECGRVPSHKQPSSAVDDDLASEFWTRTEDVLGESWPSDF